MFSESAELEAHLTREIEGPGGARTVVPVQNGEWAARDVSGILHRVRWTDRVRRREMSQFDVVLHASYGARAQIQRWQAAVDDVAAHTPEDVETRRLIVELTVRRNGRPPEKVVLASAPRRP
jgi:hypothetical protein